MLLDNLLSGFKGYRTKMAAIVLILVAINSIYPVLSAEAVTGILSAAGGLGLYFLREALANLEKQLPVTPTPVDPPK